MDLGDGDVLIAAITSCTNTSNPSVMLGAGLLAKKAVERGLSVSPRVKASLAPGSRVVTEYLARTGLQPYLDRLGFNLVGYGCTTCIGNSGPLDPRIEEVVTGNDIVAASVLSGNRNFEARIQQNIKANFLMSPPLVVAFALAGRVDIDMTRDPLGRDHEGRDVYLRDIWPSPAEIRDALQSSTDPETYRKLYSDFADRQSALERDPGHGGKGLSLGRVLDVHPGAAVLRELLHEAGGDPRHPRRAAARHLRRLGHDRPHQPGRRHQADVARRPLPAGEGRRAPGLQQLRLAARQRPRHDARNVRQRADQEPDGARHRRGRDGPPSRRREMLIYDAAMKYQAERVPLVVLAGQEYGTGSSRDWAAKGTRLLGVKAVVAQSFERIHRSNLVGMGVLPCQFRDGQSAKTLGLDGSEIFDLTGLESGLRPRQEVTLTIHRADGRQGSVPVIVRIDTPIEVDYYRHGGILPLRPAPTRRSALARDLRLSAHRRATRPDAASIARLL